MDTTNQPEAQETQETQETQEAQETQENTSMSKMFLQHTVMQNQREQIEHHMKIEEDRRNHEKQMELRRVKVDMIKVATDTLVSNSKSKPVEERDVSAEDIKEFADNLVQYINQVE
jgi:hypothetical protein